MSDCVGMLILGTVLLIIGILNRKGKIETLHSYHRKRVSEEDRMPFGKEVGLGTIICGGAIVFSGILTGLSIILKYSIIVLIGDIVGVIGVFVGIAITFHAIMKYNKGLF